jgi:hypothetical protein
MTRTLVIINDTVLLACASMYLGTGWSIILFSFPIAPKLTPDNYFLQFVPQVRAATRFFTIMTIVMIATCLVMLVSEWGHALMWVPVVVLLGILAATGLTMRFLFPYNNAMAAGITDQDELNDVLRHWMALNRIRVGLWTIQWFSLATFFAVRAR